MEERLKSLEEQQKELQVQIKNIQLKLVELSLRQEQVIANQEKYSSGINRALWVIGGGFLLSLWTWVSGGGLER